MVPKTPNAVRHAFGLIGTTFRILRELDWKTLTTFRELDWKTLIFFERVAPICPNAP
jgi:hypothetical protein